MATRG
jgi:hypothetical protein